MVKNTLEERNETIQNNLLEERNETIQNNLLHVNYRPYTLNGRFSHPGGSGICE
jgi:hypothetical protein